MPLEPLSSGSPFPGETDDPGGMTVRDRLALLPFGPSHKSGPLFASRFLLSSVAITARVGRQEAGALRDHTPFPPGRPIVEAATFGRLWASAEAFGQVPAPLHAGSRPSVGGALIRPDPRGIIELNRGRNRFAVERSLKQAGVTSRARPAVEPGRLHAIPCTGSQMTVALRAPVRHVRETIASTDTGARKSMPGDFRRDMGTASASRCPARHPCDPVAGAATRSAPCRPVTAAPGSDPTRTSVTKRKIGDDAGADHPFSPL